MHRRGNLFSLGGTATHRGTKVSFRSSFSKRTVALCVSVSLWQAVAVPLFANSAPQYAAVVDAHYTGKEGDSVSGAPVYRSIGAALSGMSANGGARAIVFIRNGRYREKLTIDRPRITLRGENRDSTVITYDAAADTPSPGGGRYGTRGSFTLRVVAPDFRAENLTIENSFDYAANAAKSDSDSTKFRNPQAVALMTDLGSDRATFVNVKILGHQDTLFANSGRQYFYKCYIAGHVDFIFGAGKAVFDQCEIVSLDRGSRTNNGYVTAASTPAWAPWPPAQCPPARRTSCAGLSVPALAK